jgi:hypothetical protein
VPTLCRSSLALKCFRGKVACEWDRGHAQSGPPYSMCNEYQANAYNAEPSTVIQQDGAALHSEFRLCFHKRATNVVRVCVSPARCVFLSSTLSTPITLLTSFGLLHFEISLNLRRNDFISSTGNPLSAAHVSKTDEDSVAPAFGESPGGTSERGIGALTNPGSRSRSCFKLRAVRLKSVED